MENTDLTVNGARRSVGTAPGSTVAEALRDGLGLTGTKTICGTGACGSCTVLLDGEPAAACTTPCAEVGGREVTTVEGLGGDHPVQRAFAAHDALQCGYCTPGFVVAAAAFTDRWRAENGDGEPARAEVAEALAGHVCRCGAYEGILAAVAAACAGKHDAPDGTAPARVEAAEKTTGRARYTTDVRLPGQLEGVLVRSPHPHARVGAVPAAHDGAAAVVDLLGADRTARWAGQPVAAVAAPTRAAALAAAAALPLEWTPLPAVLDADAARRPDAPLVYGTAEARRAAPRSNEAPPPPAKWRGNVRGPADFGWRGGTAAKRIAAARARGDERLVSAVFTTAAQSHSSPEPHACVAHWDGAGDLHLHVSTQSVAKVRAAAAKRWGLAPERVHVHAEHVGGGFGAKVGLGVETVAAAELARAAGAPVRVVFTRAEELAHGGHRPATRAELSLLADADGNLAALTLDVHGDGGTAVGTNSAALARYLYGTAPRRLRDHDVVTHTPPGLPFRAPGGPPMAWALEQAVDEAAHRLGEDPIALRRRWDGNPRRAAVYDWAAALPAWAGRAPSGSATGRFRRGVGVATANWLYLLDPAAEVELTVEGGVVVARTATQDIGTGSRSVIADVLRAELGLPADRVRVEVGHSGTVHGPASAASSGTPSIGPAALDAAARLRAALPGGPAAALDGAEGLRVVGRRRRDRRGYVTPFPLGGLAIGRGFAGAVNVTEVEVDTGLGTVRPLRIWAGIAAGRIYAERLARSQCEGGIVQGVGYALHEERRTDPVTGAVLTDSLDSYRLPRIGDIPEITVRFHEEGWEHVPGGGVGLGEISTVAVAASIGNAVHNATGWRPLDLPIRPDRVLAGLAGLPGRAAPGEGGA
ncbi:molybdopterin-dependent oxidoreductase [Streptomyces sp. NPDC001380]|uniref:molybdopterin-dependent oxidoreductase n=1 Tax=Streptomyces sp. NPDC001380 TaxID=3364566 RepID=UPI0036909116